MDAIANAKEYIKATGDFKAKPCPFCGGEEIVFTKYDHAAGERYAIFCTNCIAAIDPGWAQSKITVLDMWNRRIV